MPILPDLFYQAKAQGSNEGFDLSHQHITCINLNYCHVKREGNKMKQRVDKGNIYLTDDEELDIHGKPTSNKMTDAEEQEARELHRIRSEQVAEQERRMKRAKSEAKLAKHKERMAKKKEK